MSRDVVQLGEPDDRKESVRGAQVLILFFVTKPCMAAASNVAKFWLYLVASFRFLGMASEKVPLTPVVELRADLDGLAPPGRAERVVAGLELVVGLLCLSPPSS
jgi:hypothetical protein